MNNLNKCEYWLCRRQADKRLRIRHRMYSFTAKHCEKHGDKVRSKYRKVEV